jgi:hypothetical protein
MKEEIELFISKIAKVIKGKNYLYCVCKKGYHCVFIEAARRLQLKKQDSLIFVRHGNQFTLRNEFEGLSFKGLLIYGSLAKLIKNELTIYTIPEFKKEVFNKKDAFLLAYILVDENLKFSLLKNNIELDLKIFLETGEEKEKQKK